ncbi:baseplate J/gp47 family protein [bacterium]|nr:MAG: baseplate J/gp47 family protein [bacterium]
MAYVTKTYDGIRQAILNDYANQIPGADVSSGSDIYVKASALASAMWGLYQNQAWVARQIFPDTADADELEKHVSLRGLARKTAVKASGTVTFTGTTGIAVTAGLTLKTAEGVEFITTAGGTIANGALIVAAEAKDGGISGNIAASTALTIQDPSAGLNSAATSAAAFTGGTDKESDAALLARLLDVLRQPPAGGNSSDYKNWALEVDGVTEVYVYPLRLGLGTVTVVPLIAGSGSGRIPAQTVIDAVIAQIDAVRPITVKTVQVLAPTAKPENVTAEVRAAEGYTFSQIKPWVESAITGYIDKLKPLETLYKSKLESVISNVEGVDDRKVTVPADNIAPADYGTLVEMITAGTITITEMA